jgi:hypothetical protein
VTLPIETGLRPVLVEFHREFHCIKHTDVAKRECESSIRCEKSFIAMKLHLHSYIVFSLSNYAHETCTETGIIC